MPDKIKSLHYRILRGYITEVANKKAGDIDKDVASNLGCSVPTIESITAGSRIFSWNEAKQAVEYFINGYSKNTNCDPVIFRRMLYYFLMASANAEDEEVSKFLNKHLDMEVTDNTNTPIKVYSNLPKSRGIDTLIHSDELFEEIEKGMVSNKIIFIDGFTGTGKTCIAAYYSNYCLEKLDDIYQAVIWNEDTGGNLTLNTIISNILSTFEHENIGNMNNQAKQSAALRHLKSHKSILVIDSFESISSDEKFSVMEFVLNKVAQNTSVIITCNNTISSYLNDTNLSNIIKNNLNRFHEVRLPNLNLEQWTILANTLKESFPDIKTALQKDNELKQFVFNRGEGNPYVMSHLLGTLSSNIAAGIHPESAKKDYSEIDLGDHDRIVKKTISNLSENELRLLSAMSLFAVPATISEISKISDLNVIYAKGEPIKNTPLYNSRMKCCQQILIERVEREKTIRYSLPSLLRSILRAELRNGKCIKFLDIIENWISFYKELAGNIGFCFNDLSRFKVLDSDNSAKQVENVKAVLAYCYENRRWNDFYEISENTKYYFYIRGISGSGKQSVHYKRALAAKTLGNGINEFNSLIYHCNVSCKTRELDGINECFSWIDGILNKSHKDIPQIDIMKYVYTRALYLYACEDYENAKTKFEEYKNKISSIISRGYPRELHERIQRDYIAGLKWYSSCLYHLALSAVVDSKSYTEKAIAMLEEAIKKSKLINFKRAIVHSLLLKVEIYYNIHHDIESAKNHFHFLKQYLDVVNNDVEYNDKYKRLMDLLVP